MIGITNPPGRFILKVAHDVVIVDAVRGLSRYRRREYA